MEVSGGPPNWIMYSDYYDHFSNEYQLSSSIIRNWFLDGQARWWIWIPIYLLAQLDMSGGGAIKWSIIDALHKLYSLLFVVVVILEINSSSTKFNGGPIWGKCGRSRTCSNLPEESTIKLCWWWWWWCKEIPPIFLWLIFYIVECWRTHGLLICFWISFSYYRSTAHIYYRRGGSVQVKKGD